LINPFSPGDYPEVSTAVASLRSHVSKLREHPVPSVVLEDERSAFVRTHLAFVWRALRRFGVPDADAPDATQRVFIVATARLARIEPGRERAFLFGTALRVASKVRRARARSPLASEAWEPDDHASAGPSTEELVDERKARAVLDGILDDMTDELRAVFVLYELEQMTMAEIAELLELPAGTVASRLRRAREYFRERVARRALRSGETP
jgi:RNA polymerase sigma-70 factor (ECF subfamily)